MDLAKYEISYPRFQNEYLHAYSNWKLKFYNKERYLTWVYALTVVTAESAHI